MAGAYHRGEWFDVDDAVKTVCAVVEALESARYECNDAEIRRALFRAVQDLEEITFVEERECRSCGKTHRGLQCPPCEKCGEDGCDGRDCACPECGAVFEGYGNGTAEQCDECCKCSGCCECENEDADEDE